MSLHVLPINDEKEHTETTDCHCGPRVEWSDPDTGEIYANGPLVIHNAFDCREIVEEAERIKRETSQAPQ